MTDPDHTVPDATEHSVSTVHHALRARRRRLVVRLLAQRVCMIPHRTASSQPTDSPDNRGVDVSVRQLAREIVSIEQNVSIEHATGDAYHNVYTALIQNHLSKLDDYGAIQYEADRKRIAPGRNLFGFALVAGTTPALVQAFFDSEEIELYSGGPPTVENATDN